MANRFAFCAILPADARGSSTIDRSEVVQCRCVRMDSDAIPCSRGGPRGDADCEPLFRYAADRGSDKPDKYFWLLGSHPIGGKRKLWRRLALAAWLVLVAASLARLERHLPEYLSHRCQTAEVQAQNLRSYLATGDALYLAGAPEAEKIPYPVSSRLRELLDTSEIRAALPPELLSRDTPQNFVEAFKRNFLRLSFVWLGLGVLLLIATIASAALTPVRPRAHGVEGPTARR